MAQIPNKYPLCTRTQDPVSPHIPAQTHIWMVNGPGPGDDAAVAEGWNTEYPPRPGQEWTRIF